MTRQSIEDDPQGEGAVFNIGKGGFVTVNQTVVDGVRVGKKVWWRSMLPLN